MKKWHRGLEQTKRHFWLKSFEPQEDTDRFMICLRGTIAG
jgi:hypothetical protein